jgi:hypothetical protein
MIPTNKAPKTDQDYIDLKKTMRISGQYLQRYFFR